jgi:hypothetical protein
MTAAPDERAPDTVGTSSRALGETDSSANVGDRPEFDKVFATLRARLALRGFCLQPLSGGEFLVHRWNLHRLLPSLDAVQRFAKLVGA